MRRAAKRAGMGAGSETVEVRAISDFAGVPAGAVGKAAYEFVGLAGRPSVQALCDQARRATTLSFFKFWHETRRNAFGEGFQLAYDDRLAGELLLNDQAEAPGGPSSYKQRRQEAAERRVADELMQQRARWSVVQREIWTEYLLSWSAVVWLHSDWKDAAGRPVLYVWGPEDCQWSRSNNVDKMRVRLASQPVSGKDLAGYPVHWHDGLKKDGFADLDVDKGDWFRVLTRTRRGTGFADPPIRSALDDVQIMSLLVRGEYNLAWVLKDVIRHIKVGHEIKGGPNEGAPTHFMTKRAAKALKDALAKMDAQDIVTNFDREFDFPSPDAERLSKDRFGAVYERLRWWAGPYVQCLMEAEPSSELRRAAASEGFAYRDEVCGFLNACLNDPATQSRSPRVRQAGLVAAYSPTTFLTADEATKAVMSGVQAGIMSVQTGREWLRLDHQRESARIRAEHQKREEVTPAFEQKQGIVAGEISGAEQHQGGSP